MNTEQTRVENIHRCLDATFAHYEGTGIDMKEVDRLELHRVMSSIANDLAIPDKHFENAYAHQIAELNGLPSTFLEPITNKNKIMKKKNEVAPMMPIQFMEKQDEKDEPTVKRSRSQRIEPYFSPMMKLK